MDPIIESNSNPLSFLLFLNFTLSNPLCRSPRPFAASTRQNPRPPGRGFAARTSSSFVTRARPRRSAGTPRGSGVCFAWGCGNVWKRPKKNCPPSSRKNSSAPPASASASSTAETPRTQTGKPGKPTGGEMQRRANRPPKWPMEKLEKLEKLEKPRKRGRGSWSSSRRRRGSCAC